MLDMMASMMPKLEIEVLNIEYDEAKTNATAHCKMHISGGIAGMMGEDMEAEEADIPLVQINGKWYINDDNMMP